MNDTNGTFYAVGVGPGDPELLTLQAANILKRCPVIAAPQTMAMVPTFSQLMPENEPIDQL